MWLVLGISLTLPSVSTFNSSHTINIPYMLVTKLLDFGSKCQHA